LAAILRMMEGIDTRLLLALSPLPSGKPDKPERANGQQDEGPRLRHGGGRTADGASPTALRQ
jgi:hypothetical protein